MERPIMCLYTRRTMPLCLHGDRCGRIDEGDPGNRVDDPTLMRSARCPACATAALPPGQRERLCGGIVRLCAAYPLAATRLMIARNLLLAGRVTPIRPGCTAVGSELDQHTTYVIDAQGCDCADADTAPYGRCAHRWAALLGRLLR